MRPSDKLDYKKFRPFEVKEKISTSNYWLVLPVSIRLHPIFHISLLELVLEGTQFDKPRLYIEVHEEVFEVEAILDK